MKFRQLVLAGAIALCMQIADAAPVRIEVVEKSFESSTAEVRIPAAENASLTMRHCPDCPPVTLRITAQSSFFVDEEQVTQAEFRKATERRTASMTVYYLPESKDVTRIVMHVR